MKKAIYKIEIFMLFITILLILIPNSLYKNIIAIIATGILLFVTILLYGNKKDNDFYKWSAFRLMLVVILSYFILISLSGLILGFNRTLFSLNIRNWFNRVCTNFTYNVNNRIFEI